MAITLQQVAAKDLSAQRMGVIEHIFSKGAHKSVMVLVSKETISYFFCSENCLLRDFMIRLVQVRV